MNVIKMEEQVEQVKQVDQKMNEKLSKYLGLTAAELMIGFWFGVGAILAIKMVNSLEELISR